MKEPRAPAADSDAFGTQIVPRGGMPAWVVLFETHALRAGLLLREFKFRESRMRFGNVICQARLLQVCIPFRDDWLLPTLRSCRGFRSGFLV